MENRRIHEPHIFAARAFALTAGFGLAAILITVCTSKSLFGVWWIALMQTHGHAQLFGWAGLFVLVTSIALHTISQPIISLWYPISRLWDALA